MNIHAPSADLLDAVLSRNEKIHGGGTKPDESLNDAMITERVIESCTNVLTTMCKIEVALTDPSEVDAKQAFDLSGVIAISGARAITLAVKLSQELAFAAAESLIGITPTEIDADVIDLVGELANMIAGSAKERLNHHKLTLGLPTVVTGHGHKITFANGMKVSTLDFQCEAGLLQLEVGIAPDE